ncbi:hypothetical protein WS90_21565 [Burkholderia cepacia]|uniref:Uncharacterized protein n=1 Tax=Burkholderia cepacia TaxID=292 RepID=A0A103ZCU4_BURCE|nr:hypothetical protein [Burkholderia cepacia]KVK77745.1 hypothetical protein WS90_21565 [Burkholderia cepacia]
MTYTFSKSHAQLVRASVALLSAGESRELDEACAQPLHMPEEWAGLYAALVCDESMSRPDWPQRAAVLSCEIELAMIERARELDALANGFAMLEAARMRKSV